MSQPTGGRRQNEMPDFEPESDDDESIGPWYNDQGEFGDFQLTDIEEMEDDN